MNDLTGTYTLNLPTLVRHNAFVVLLLTCVARVVSSNARRKGNHQTFFSNFKNLPALLFLSTFFLPVANAATYYVATNGNDSNPGTLSSPWRSINKAANTLVGGDTVNIRAGTYKEQVNPKNSGYSGAFITYAAYPGETVTVDGSNGFSYAWNGLFNLSNRSYIQVSGMRLVNSPGFAVFMSNARNIRILKNYTSNTFYSGVYAEKSDTVTVDGNEVDQANRGKNQESISIVGTQNYVVSNNRVHGGYMEGIDAKLNSSNGKIFGNTVYNMARVGLYLDAWDTTSNNIEVYNNTVSNSQSGDSGASEDGIRMGAEHGGTMSNIKIYNNVLYNIAQSGIAISNWTEPGYNQPKFSTVSMYNNTIYNSGIKSGGGIDIQGSQSTGINIRNNIISKAKSFNIRSSSGTTISNNLFDGGSTSGTSAVSGNPVFVAAANNDFHIQSTSPAVNTGTTSGAPTFDFDYKTRPQGGQVDIGAFEYGSSSTTTDSTPPSAPTNLAAASPDSSKVNLSWSASTDNVGVTGYKIYRNGAEIGTSAVASFTDTSVVAGTTYNYTVKAYDKVGNLSASSNTATVTPPQGTAVNISSYSVANITANSAQINWTTNTPSTGTVSYGTSATNLSSQVNAGNTATSQSAQLTGLAGATTYYYKISAGTGSVNSSFKTAAASGTGSGTNMALSASVTASSQNTGTSQQAIKAIDGVIDGIGTSTNDYTREWATIGQKAGAWIQLNWTSSRQVSKVVLYDRPNTDDQITSATLTFSNGSKINLGTLNNTGGAVTINFAPVNTNSVRLTVNTVSGSTLNIGLAELQVF